MTAQFVNSSFAWLFLYLGDVLLGWSGVWVLYRSLRGYSPTSLFLPCFACVLSLLYLALLVFVGPVGGSEHDKVWETVAYIFLLAVVGFLRWGIFSLPNKKKRMS